MITKASSDNDEDEKEEIITGYSNEDSTLPKQLYEVDGIIFRYYSGFDYKHFNLKFQTVRKEQKGNGYNIGKYCWLSFYVSDCYEGCETCKKYSADPDNQLCLSCDESHEYYILNSIG